MQQCPFQCGHCFNLAVSPRRPCICGGPTTVFGAYCSGCDSWVPVGEFDKCEHKNWRGDSLERFCRSCKSSGPPERPAVYRWKSASGETRYVGSCAFGSSVRYREHWHAAHVYPANQPLHDELPELQFEELQGGCESSFLTQYEFAWMLQLSGGLPPLNRYIPKGLRLDENAPQGRPVYPRAMVRFELIGGRVVLDHSEPRQWPPHAEYLGREQWYDYFRGLYDPEWPDLRSSCTRCGCTGHRRPTCPIEQLDQDDTLPPPRTDANAAATSPPEPLV